MKKICKFSVWLICVLSLAGCGKNMADVTIDYGDSRLYTTQDMDAAISLIETTFATWKGCELHRISYISDEECNADTEYTGWKWWLARSDGGEWKLMTWGY